MSAADQRQPALLIVIASTRPGRVGLPVGRWFEERARTHGRFEELVRASEALAGLRGGTAAS